LIFNVCGQLSINKTDLFLTNPWLEPCIDSALEFKAAVIKQVGDKCTTLAKSNETAEYRMNCKKDQLLFHIV